MRNLRKDALEEALMLEQEKVEIEQRLLSFYEKHETLFESLRSSPGRRNRRSSNTNTKRIPPLLL